MPVPIAPTPTLTQPIVPKDVPMSLSPTTSWEIAPVCCSIKPMGRAARNEQAAANALLSGLQWARAPIKAVIHIFEIIRVNFGCPMEPVLALTACGLL